MANITLMGASYNDVTAVSLPQTGGGIATFHEVSGTQTITENDTYDVTGLAQVVVNVAGGGSGLTYEEGTYSPDADIERPTISFADSHTDMPIFIMLSDVTNNYSSVANSNYLFLYVDWYKVFGAPFYYNNSTRRYGYRFAMYRQSSATSMTSTSSNFAVSSDNTTETNATYPRYFVKPTEFRPFSSNTFFWRASRTYKWMAIWKS